MANNNSIEFVDKDGKCNLKGSKKVRSHRIENSVKRCLIVENMQNCFFSGGSMGFKNRGDENKFLKTVNKLISLHEVDERYNKASKSGREKKGVFTDSQGIETGTRKKNYFDIIIFTQDGNPPDHWSFASHHYLREGEKYDYFSGSNKGKKKTYKCTGKRCRKKTKILLPDHALTDGSDRYKSDGKERIGIEFHPRLDLRSLYRPSQQFHHSVYIKKPMNFNRGFILFKGGEDSDSKSAFKNSVDKKTGLSKFLECNGINSLFICGMGRENSITNSLFDSSLMKKLAERVMVYDATMPIGIDYLGEKDVFKKTLEKNKYVKKLRENGIKVVTYDSMLSNIKRGESIHDREIPEGVVGKSMRSMEDLFSTAVKK